MKALSKDLIKAVLWCILIILIIYLSMGYSSNFIYTDF
jgi:hypothetical protein